LSIADDSLLLAMANDGVIEISREEYEEALARVQSFKASQVDHLEMMGPEEIA